MADTVAPEKKVTGAENVIWDLSALYDGIDDPKIATDTEKLRSLVDEYASTYRGRVAELSPEEMKTALDQSEIIQDLFGRLINFANLTFTTNSTDPKIGALLQKMEELGAEIGQKLVFFDLEWTKLDDENAQVFLDAPELEKYHYKLESDRRYKPYKLSETEEQVIMEKNVTGRSAWVRFFETLTTVMRFDFDGEKLSLEEILVDKLKDPDREVRKKAADALTSGMKENAMQLTYIFNTIAADKASDDRRRGYPSWVSSRNLANLAPDDVVNALVSAVTSNYDLVERHYNLKRVLLGVDELYDYDRYAPLPIEESDAFYHWDEARELIVSAFRAFNDELADAADAFFENKWIHAPILPEKQGGAYSSRVVPGAHPVVFMNYQGNVNSVSTLAHELGHGIHAYLSGKAHGFQGVSYPLTTAEMASTFGEMLVFQDLMGKEENPEVRLAMLVQKIEDSFGTIFRQIAMNRFEDGFHTARRTEGELSGERFNQIWLETQRAMYGDSVTLRDDYGAWWGYIWHFIGAPGYVYAYAFGELLVLSLYKLYLERGESFAPEFIEILRAGGSDYPHNILARVGIDLNDPDFWQGGLDALADMIAQEETLAREVYPDKFA